MKKYQNQIAQISANKMNLNMTHFNLENLYKAVLRLRHIFRKVIKLH